MENQDTTCCESLKYKSQYVFTIRKQQIQKNNDGNSVLRYLKVSRVVTFGISHNLHDNVMTTSEATNKSGEWNLCQMSVIFGSRW